MNIKHQIIASFISVCAACNAVTTPKAESVKFELSVVYKVYEFAIAEDQSNLDSQITHLIANIYSLDRLSGIAIMLWNIAAPETAGDERFDKCFVEAFWKVIAKISMDRSPEGKAALQLIEQRIFLDGGDRERFRRLRDAQSLPSPNP